MHIFHLVMHDTMAYIVDNIVLKKYFPAAFAILL